jgi:hypothetical protein
MNHKVCFVFFTLFFLIMATISARQTWHTTPLSEVKNVFLAILNDNDIGWMDIHLKTGEGLEIIPLYVIGSMDLESGYITERDFRIKGGILEIYFYFIPQEDEELSYDKKLKGISLVSPIVGNLASNTPWKFNKLTFTDMNENIEFWISIEDCKKIYEISKTGDLVKSRDYLLEHLHEVK